MKIVYVADINIDITSGVLNKMNTQINYWVEMGHEVHVACLAPFRINKTDIKLTPKVAGICIPVSGIIPRFVKGQVYNILNKIVGLREIKQYLETLQPDLIYMREMVGFPGLNKLLSAYTVVLESNTLLKDELKLYSYKARKLYALYQEKLYSTIDGFIGVTNEIRDQFKAYGKPVCTISNGINTDNFAAVRERRSGTGHQERANIILVGSPHQDWHGADKFYLMAEQMPEADFHLVGIEAPGVERANFFVHGYLDKDALMALYHKADIGVGTLALHRKNMEEACPLKVREYAALGLPMIIAYYDADFQGQDFVLQLENKEDCILPRIEDIRTFVQKWKHQKISPDVIAPLVSVTIKERDRLSFMTQVSNK
ncbi:glycosyltransferase family 4 protein [Taibaiella koreensis]|uniref:glycosyltransferase family 4 protein n=1 Tax=Taibaiella koreensis TaxID=1268548 RepID=UPI000E59D52E|nr:glycosyltransferase family 4 protein [Taibaiella koreensis]